MSAPIKSTFQKQNWHAMPAKEVLQFFNATEEGLATEAVKGQRLRFGANSFSKPTPPSLLRKIISQLRSPLAAVLLIAFVVTATLGEYVDAGVIGLALCIAVVISLFQEGKASRAFSALSDSQVQETTVIRDGKRHQIAAEEVVCGDLVELTAGDQVPADVRIFEAKHLRTNEAALTGEWLPVKKSAHKVAVGSALADRGSMAYKGTFVAEGRALSVVVAVGDDTEVGQIAVELKTIEDEETPVQAEMRKVSRVLVYLILFLIVGIFILGITHDHTWHEMLIMSIAIAVASIPEGLPAAVTIILAIGMESLLKRGGLVKNLLAAETLGSTTFVLTDKTGTLTEARMSLVGALYGDELLRDFGHGVGKTVLDISLCATDAFVDTEDGEEVLRGDAVERAILEEARFHGISDLRQARTDYLSFTSENRFAAGVSTAKEEFQICINGAPEFLLSAAQHIHTKEGIKKLSDTHRAEILAHIEVESKKGNRLVAVSYRSHESKDLPESPNAILKDSIFFGVFIFKDPVRAGVADAIAGVQQAGAEVRLVTGDNAATALTIASEVGIANQGERVITGPELDDMSDDELLRALREVHVFARILPKQKQRLAEVLQRAGEIVAMTGDGVNDAPALQKANIGVAVGSGTMVAKESADLVLINDSFATIYAAIEEGRRVIANLRKVIGYLLSTSLGEVVIIGSALLVGAPAPLLPVQILWANIIEEGLMGIAFAFEKGEKGAMRRRPQDIHAEGVLSRKMIWFLVLVVGVLSIISVSFYFYLRSLGVSEEIINSGMFLLVAVDSLFMAFAFRSLTVPMWRVPLADNKFFIGSFLLSSGLLFAALSIPFLRGILSYTPLPSELVWLVIAASVISLAAVEIAKAIFFERKM